jgi:hypothetical protein
LTIREKRQMKKQEIFNLEKEKKTQEATSQLNIERAD